jgi:two-component system, cell cycle sensor histidine kinase and response regulator CckA
MPLGCVPSGAVERSGDRLGGAFDRLAEKSVDGMVLLRAGRYVYANRAWASWLGREPDELAGQRFLDHVPAEDRRSLEAWLEGKDSEDVAEYRFANEAGTTTLLQVNRVEVDQETVGLVGRDLTRQRRNQAKLLLADRMMSVGALAAGTAHEINNPLTYVQGNIGFALEEVRANRSILGDEKGEELEEALTEAQEGAERVRVIVRRLHAFSRADQDELRRIDVNRVVDEAVNMAFTEIRHRARLLKELGAEAVVQANEARLGQVVLNLLLNAAHALPEGKAEENFIRVATSSSGGEVRLQVQDSGPGIPPEVLGRVFDSMFTTKPVGVGTGLGLSIAHSIVTDFGGRIDVSSTLGQGTSFEVVLPAAERRKRPRRSRSSIEPSDAGRRANLLVIDDEPLIAAALKRALREHEVEVAGSGRAAIELLMARKGAFDLVFCDLMMPDLTGMDVYEWSQANLPGIQPRFVFMTGGIFTPRAQRFLESVRLRNRSIQKPFDLGEIRRYVRQRLSGELTGGPSIDDI